MRLSLRFILPLALVLAGLAYAVIPLVDTLTLKWFVRDLEIRSRLIASTIEGPLADLLSTESKTKLLQYFHRLTQDERLYAIRTPFPAAAPRRSNPIAQPSSNCRREPSTCRPSRCRRTGGCSGA
jgi:hypothetical protein